MIFNTPTSKAEMFEILKDIYTFYRLNQAQYLGTPRSTMTLQRISYSVLTDSQLALKAQNLIDGAFEREKRKTEDELNDKLDALREKRAKLIEEYEGIFGKIEQKYDGLKKELQDEASKKGLSYSSVLTEKMYALENERANEIMIFQTKKSEKLSELDGKIASLQTRIDGLSQYFSDLRAKDVQAKTIELKAEQDKYYREITRYNNSVEEKETTYNNASLTEQKSFELRFLEIKSKGTLKEELVESGYYADVLTCMAGYYDTLSAVNAYNDILNEKRLIPYLEDFYQDFVYIYKTRALD